MLKLRLAALVLHVLLAAMMVWAARDIKKAWVWFHAPGAS